MLWAEFQLANKSRSNRVSEAGEERVLGVLVHLSRKPAGLLAGTGVHCTKVFPGAPDAAHERRDVAAAAARAAPRGEECAQEREDALNQALCIPRVLGHLAPRGEDNGCMS